MAKKLQASPRYKAWNHLKLQILSHSCVGSAEEDGRQYGSTCLGHKLFGLEGLPAEFAFSF